MAGTVAFLPFETVMDVLADVPVTNIELFSGIVVGSNEVPPLVTFCSVVLESKGYFVCQIFGQAIDKVFKVSKANEGHL